MVNDNNSSGVGSSNASLEQLHHNPNSVNGRNTNGGTSQIVSTWSNPSSQSTNKYNQKPNNSGVRYRLDYIRPPPPLPQRRY